MKFKLPASNFELTPAGIHAARIARIVYLGTQPPLSDKPSKWNKDPKPQRKLRIFFELPGALVAVGDEKKPAWTLADINFSTGQRATLTKLRKAVGVSTEGDDLDFDDLLGRPLTLTVVHKKGNDGKIYANTDTESFAGLPAFAAQSLPDIVGDSFCFNLEEPNEALIEKLGPGTIKKLSYYIVRAYPLFQILKLLG